MALAAYLCLEGYRHIRCESINGSHLSQMIFHQEDGMDDAIAEFNTGNATVEPSEFVRKLAWVRTRLMDSGRNGS